VAPPAAPVLPITAQLQASFFPHLYQRNPTKDDKFAKLQGRESSCLHNPYYYDESFYKFLSKE